jgi:radical SAM superfamily enzyme YgiQ (UPF0313 family)
VAIPRAFPKPAATRPPRLLLVYPARQKLGWVRRFQLPPLSLMHIAACTPEPWEVVLADEVQEPLPSAAGFDLVGITAMTEQAPRAYELAARYRSEGARVVLGGIHPTVLPEEAGLHADSVVVGEAEPIWGQVLSDALSARLARRYVAPEPSGDNLLVPWARKDILVGKRYLTTQTLQASRGCPYDCPFCTVTPYFGRRFRYRSAEDILAELRTFRNRMVIFLDDNLLGDPARAVPLIQGLKRMDFLWAAQITLKVAEDPELLRLLERSGCFALFVGIESLKGEGSKLAKLRSRFPPADLVKRIQDAGILVETSIIFGFDDHTESVFEEAVKFVEECAPCGPTFHLLTPYPGTEFFRRYEEAGRILHRNWDLYNMNEVVFRPKNMTPDRLYRGWVEARQAVYAWPALLSRVLRTRHHRFANLAYNVLRKAPNDHLNPLMGAAEGR